MGLTSSVVVDAVDDGPVNDKAALKSSCHSTDRHRNLRFAQDFGLRCPTWHRSSHAVAAESHSAS